MVNYFYLSFTKLQTHKMKFKNIKAKHLTSNICLKVVCEAKPTILKRPSLGDGFENHMSCNDN